MNLYYHSTVAHKGHAENKNIASNVLQISANTLNLLQLYYNCSSYIKVAAK